MIKFYPPPTIVTISILLLLVTNFVLYKFGEIIFPLYSTAITFTLKLKKVSK